MDRRSFLGAVADGAACSGPSGNGWPSTRSGWPKKTAAFFGAGRVDHLAASLDFISASLAPAASAALEKMLLQRNLVMELSTA